MATASQLRDRVRFQIGDRPEPFRTSIRGTGEQTDFEIDAEHLLADTVRIFSVNADGTVTTFVVTTDYTLDTDNGIVYFEDPPELDSTIIIEGSSYGLFSDEELDPVINEAVMQHTVDRTLDSRYRDSHGFIQYRREFMTMATLPDVEVGLVAMLASVELFWALATDAATDIDINTAEGTAIPRSQRYRQLIAQGENLLGQYKELCGMLGVGLFRPEIYTLRRVSHSTGRLVPVFVEREYDEAGPPVRVLPPIQERDADPDGPASPWYPSGYGP
jgi:hypothetical protein